VAAVSKRFRAVLLEPKEYNIVAATIEQAAKQMKKIASRRDIPDIAGKLNDENREQAKILFIVEHPFD